MQYKKVMRQFFILITVCVFVIVVLVGCSYAGNTLAKIPLHESADFTDVDLTDISMPEPEISETSEIPEISTSRPTEPETEPTTAQTTTQATTEELTATPTAEPETEPTATETAAPETEPAMKPLGVYENNIEDYNSQAADEIAQNYYLLPSYWIQSDNKEIIDLAASITGGISDEYEKARAIYTWVAGNIWQDLDYKNGDTEYKMRRVLENTVDAQNTLNTKFGMCVNYANLTVALARAATLPAKIIRLSDGHEFCEVYAGGRWIIMDTYFDSGNKYENGKFGPAKPCGSRFFDMAVQDIWERRAWYFQQYVDFAQYVEKGYFYGNTNLQSVVIPEGFYSIGYIAFYGCENLTSVYIPESVTSIGELAFGGCSRDLVISGKKGSYAEIYAKENGIKFEADGAATESFKTGDVQHAEKTEEGVFVFVYNGTNIYMGEDAAPILAALGPAEYCYEYEEGCVGELFSVVKKYTYEKFKLTTRTENKTDENDRERIYSLDFYDETISTHEGLHIGQTFFDMVSIYGTAYTEQQSFVKIYKYIKNGTSLSFGVKNDIVMYILYGSE